MGTCCHDRYIINPPRIPYVDYLHLGILPDDLAAQTIGPLCHARWLTLAVRALAKWARTKKPTRKFREIVEFILNLYLPIWFRVKSEPHCQSGARHYFRMMELAQDLSRESREVVEKVMQDNSHFAHQENIVIACLADEREEIRRKGVLHILAARREFDQEKHPRQFIPPKVNFKVHLLSVKISV